MLDEAQESLLERQCSREYNLIVRDDRLDKIAADIVTHFLARGYQGKAMVISIDRFTAVKMYNKVQHYWQLHLNELQVQLAQANVSEFELKQLQKKIQYVEETDMAVIISSDQNEVEDFKNKGLDITLHRHRLANESPGLDEKFKDPNNPLRIVFVCAMWITGFDAPSCSTVYLDKPMKNHTLMQTIARANRVFKEKVNGLIVDYIGVFRNLQKALAIYGSASGGGVKEGDTPVNPKTVLVQELREAITEAKDFCKQKGIDLNKLDTTQDAFERAKVWDEAVEAGEFIIPHSPSRQLVDLSQLDLEQLEHKFQTGYKHTEAEKLKGTVQRKLQQMVEFNKTRLNYFEKYQKMIEKYNSGSRNVDWFFNELLGLAQELTKEEKRAIAQKLTEEELAIFDLLTKPNINLSKQEEKEVKEIAQELLATLKREKLVIDWRKRQQTRASVEVAIKDVLDKLPQSYSDEMYESKCSEIYQHIYDFYAG